MIKKELMGREKKICHLEPICFINEYLRQTIVSQKVSTTIGPIGTLRNCAKEKLHPC
jgi:hypothetical protein